MFHLLTQQNVQKVKWLGTGCCLRCCRAQVSLGLVHERGTNGAQGRLMHYCGSALMLYSVMVKRELTRLLIYQPLYVPTFAYVHELFISWLALERLRIPHEQLQEVAGERAVYYTC